MLENCYSTITSAQLANGGVGMGESKKHGKKTPREFRGWHGHGDGVYSSQNAANRNKQKVKPIYHFGLG